MDQNGGAKFTENYSLAFISDFEFNDFREQVRKDIPSLDAVNADFNFFYPHFIKGTSSNVGGVYDIFFDEPLRLITLKYTLNQRFATLSSEGQRAAFFEIDERPFLGFVDGGSIVIPDNTTIRVVLPPGSEVDVGASSLPQKSELSASQLALRGIQTNSLKLRYRIIKPISPRGNDLLDTRNLYIIVPAFALAAIIVYFKREEIEEKIEGFIVRHSEIKARETEEDIDFDLE